MTAKMYTADEAAKVLDIADNTLQSLIYPGQLRAFKVESGGNTGSPGKIAEGALNNYLSEQGHTNSR